MNKAKVEDYLIADGISTAISGFDCLTSAIMNYKRGMSMTKDLYPLVANENNMTPQNAERTIRHAILRRKNAEPIKNCEYISMAHLMLERTEEQ